MMAPNFRESIQALKRDKRFARLIKKHGMPDLKRGSNIFRALVRSIVHQQLSGKAAETIHKRFLALFKGKKFPTPQDVKAMPVARLRSAGLSLQKASYIHDLAEKFSNGAIQHRKFDNMTSAEITEHLLSIKGVGVWTTHMLLIFTLNRPDVLPTGDLGIRKGFQIVYRLKELPEHKEMEKLALPWRAHASVASWYLWRAADEKKK
jgi:DNA-3-methyladenine glycosylase II